ncbi:Scr1 family TA system antitoxin-like transcriptional regulator [Kitasatospora aureofaciens]|uniref:Scr1 family TA system antitoxin-like transcriptional regulator n=1 Tax=Kitasatospora aureofaciens TaxID=1894 RepID=UPI000689F29C|nr:Scr1 family TA system antitoxin-like transcriptional regulator [Kitasatospora aureofaciens]
MPASAVAAGLVLRAMRTAAGRTPADVADRLVLPTAQLERLEYGRRTLRGADWVGPLLRLYGVKAGAGHLQGLRSMIAPIDVRAAVCDQAAGRGGRLRWASSAAARVRLASKSTVPAVLWTRPYQEQVLAGMSDLTTVDEAAYETCPELDVAPGTLTVLLGLAALRPAVGQGTVLADQLEHLLRLAESGAAVVRIVPDTASVPWAGRVLGELVLPAPDGSSLVAVEVPDAVRYHYGTDPWTAPLIQRLNRIEDLALDAGQSTALLIDYARWIRETAPSSVVAKARRTRCQPAPALIASLRELLHPLALGLTNAQIAARLGLTASGVETRATKLLHALGAANRTSAVVTAIRRGLIDLDAIPATEHRPLDDTDRQVLLLLARGLTTAQIAAELDLNHNTAKSRTTRLTRALGANSSTHAVVLGAKYHLIPGLRPEEAAPSLAPAA